MDMPRTFRELSDMLRGNEVIYKGVRYRVAYVFKSIFSTTVAFEGGLVLKSDNLLGGVSVLHEPFREEAPDF